MTKTLIPDTAFGRLLAALRTMNERARQRRELAELGDYALHDIGLSRPQVVAETSLPRWRQEAP